MHHELRTGSANGLTATRTAPAPAKINLMLHIVGRRPDGYHDLESLVVFARLGDTLSFTPAPALALAVCGPTAQASGAINDNLVLRAARALAERVDGLELGRFELIKRLPVAAGLGGGSSDAAAALRLLARINRLAVDDPRLQDAARATGADVPVCLDPRPRVMRGLGDVLSGPIELPPLPAVLVNPGVAVPTKDVFAAFHGRQREPLLQTSLAVFEEGAARRRPKMAEVIKTLAACRNDLEAPAVLIAPVISDVLDGLRALAGCRLARMSGSGATCFGLFDTAPGAAAAARALRAKHPKWWIRATRLA
jgi:4-diphosphocytidyl-2-C-methyl-D-erythritol kinase